MPLRGKESFHARVQRYNRVQIPVLVRWKHKLEVGEVLYVRLAGSESVHVEEFHARVVQGGRITIPKLVVELLGIEAGDVVYVMLYPVEQPSEEED